MVIPEWPPITGTDTLDTSNCLASATKVLARTMSSVVTPNSLQVQWRGREVASEEQKAFGDIAFSKE